VIRGRQVGFACLLSVAIASAPACSRPATEREAASAPQDTLANGFSREDAPRLRTWVGMWREAIPGFEVDSLTREGRAPAFRGGDIQSLSDATSWIDSSSIAVLGEQSPGDHYRLVFDGYQDVSESDGKIEIGGEPDSAPWLFDLRLGSANRFEFCGTSCVFDYGCWLDSLRFALAGWEFDEESRGSRGFLGIYSLADSTRTRFVTRAVPEQSRKRYAAAYDKWVTARYWAWKASAR